MRYELNSITQWFRLSSSCVLCDQTHRGKHAVCCDCQILLTPLGPSCQYCATPVPDLSYFVCGHCCKRKPHFDYVYAAHRFEEPLRALLHEFKYREGLYLCSFLASLMASTLPLKATQTELLIPIPMHPKRLRLRGFNQAALLTKHLSRLLSIPYSLNTCQKIINTPPQAGLAAHQRLSNLRHAFQVAPISYQHVTLIDDLLTTGSTVGELAKQIKKQGVKQVDVWCCARAIDPVIQKISSHHSVTTVPIPKKMR